MLFISWFMILTNQSFVIAQTPSQAGKDQFQSRGFNWYDAKTESLVDIPRRPVYQAKTLDRGDIARAAAQKNTNNTPAAPTATSNAWTTALSTTAWIIIGLIFLTIVGLLIWFFLKMEQSSTRSSDSSIDEEIDVVDRIRNLPFQLEENQKGDFQQLALNAAKRSDYGRAIVLLFTHALLFLDRQQLIQLKKGKTNRQYLNEIGDHPEITKYFKMLMIPFEDTFFGAHKIDERVFETCLGGLETFQENVKVAAQARATEP
ncbi:MAG: hypothetical protein AAGA30_16930 [Planctomycetota bacterium]